MSAELPLSTRILLVLNPSIFNIITNGSLWGCFTPLTSASLKDMSWSVCLCLNRGTIWTLFTCLWHAFLRDLNDPPMKGPPRNRLYLPDYILRRLAWTIVTPGREFTLILVAPLEVTVLPLLHIFL